LYRRHYGQQGCAVHSILAIATLKGGSGKSTVASCLAVHWRLQGRRPILIDADPQRSLIRLAAREQALAGVPVVEDSTEDVWKTARRLAAMQGPVIIDTPGFRAPATIGSLAAANFVVVPVRASPLDVDRMLDTLNILVAGIKGWRPAFRCLMTQTIRDSVIARHIRAEITAAGFPLLESEMPNRVAYSEAALYGTTPSALEPDGQAAHDIASIADEIDSILSVRQLARR
jgi:chromosome partitioning protein